MSDVDLYLHAHQAPKGDAPLVFAFHGTGGSEHQFFALVQELLPGAGVVAPRGDVSEMGAARYFRRTGEGVYDMEDLAERTDRMIRFVAAHRAACPDRPVYGLGYSNGANILAAMLFQRPDLFDRAALLHPLIPWTPAPQPGLAGRRILVTAGRRDPICPWPMTQALADYFEGQGAGVDLRAHGGGHEVLPEEIEALGGFLRDGAGQAA